MVAASGGEQAARLANARKKKRAEIVSRLRRPPPSPSARRPHAHRKRPPRGGATVSPRGPRSDSAGDVFSGPSRLLSPRRALRRKTSHTPAGAPRRRPPQRRHTFFSLQPVREAARRGVCEWKKERRAGGGGPGAAVCVRARSSASTRLCMGSTRAETAVAPGVECTLESGVSFFFFTSIFYTRCRGCERCEGPWCAGCVALAGSLCQIAHLRSFRV